MGFVLPVGFQMIQNYIMPFSRASVLVVRSHTSEGP